MIAPQIVMAGDSARTRRTDPIQSHIAGDYSQKSRLALRNNLLILVRENPGIIGTELNQMYRETYQRRGWKRVAYDSPRKRAGEMAIDGLLTVGDVRDGGQQYTIADTAPGRVTVWRIVSKDPDEISQYHGVLIRETEDRYEIQVDGETFPEPFPKFNGAGVTAWRLS